MMWMCVVGGGGHGESLWVDTNSEDYIQTLGVNFMEKTISIRKTEITFSVS